MRNTILIFTCLFFMCTVLSAQTHNIRGRITDESSTAIQYATVTLQTCDSAIVKGTVTDSTGIFLLTDINNGEYIFTASCIGFNTYTKNITVDNNDTDMDNITLHASDNMIDEVEIKGRSFIRKEGHALIIPDKKQVRHAYSAYDLLANMMIPGIDIDRQNGEVKNFTGTVSMYINGIKADTREVMALRPKDIEKVEYHDAPTGIYSNENAVINFIVRQYDMGGYISLDGKQTIGYLNGDYNAAAKIVKGSTNYKFFGGHAMSKTSFTSEEYEYAALTDNPVQRENITKAGLDKNNSQYVRFDMQNSTQKRTLTGKLSLIRNSTPRNESEESITYRTMHGTTGSDAYGKNSQTGWMPNAVFTGNFNLKSNQTLITYLDASYSRNDYDRTYSENGFKSKTEAKEDFYKALASFVYNIGLKKNNMLTVQLNHMYQNSRMAYTGDYDEKQHFWSAETFLYINYNQQISKKISLYAHAGFSSLQYKLSNRNTRNRIGPRFNVRIMAQPASNQFLQVALDVSSTYPTMDKLNDMPQTLSPLMTMRGNPDLDNSIVLQGNAGYSAQFGPVNIMTAASYYFMNKATVADFFIDSGKIISTYANAGVQLANIMAESTWKITPAINIKAKGQWLHTYMNGQESRSTNTWIGNFSADYYLKAWKINLYASLPCKIIDTQLFRKDFDYKANYGLSVSWNNRGWSVEAGTNNPFTKDAAPVITIADNNYTCAQHLHNNSMQQTAYVKVAYTFDFGKQTSKESNDTGRNINSAILKAY